MACNFEACAECTQKCLSLHGNKTKLSPVITSFFKIMIGTQCSEVLFLPPKFAPTVSELIDQKTFLEDSSGQQWEVIISSLNGSFAFHQGWNAFFLDHKLKVGDFVVFNYIVGSHFVVKIYTHSGCENQVFPENRNKRKRAKANDSYTERDGPHLPIDNSSTTKQGSSLSVVSGNQGSDSLSMVEYVEEPYYIIDRDLGDKQGDDRCIMFDLSNFEMLTSNSDTDKRHTNTISDEIFPHYADASPRSQIEAALASKDRQLLVNRVVPNNASDLELVRKNYDLQKMDTVFCNEISEHPVFTTVVKPEKNKKSISNMSNGVVKIDHIAKEEGKAQPEINKVVISQQTCTSLTHSNQTTQLKFTGKLEPDVPVTTGLQNMGGSVKIVKELMETTGELYSDNKMIQGNVPRVNEMDCDHSSDMIAIEDMVLPVVKIEESEAISCVIASDNEPFLELPSCLPSLKFQNKMRKLDKKVVHLQDPCMRIWPVLYQEKSGLNLLSSGWEAFSRANIIQAGDECVFELENYSESIYLVNILRSKASSPILPLTYSK